MSDRAIEAWRVFVAQSVAPEGIFSALAGVLARSGDAQAIGFLQVEAVAAGRDLSRATAAEIAASLAALTAAREVRRETVVEQLGLTLGLGSSRDLSFIWAGEALANLGEPSALEALIQWSREAPDQCAPLAARWIAQARDTRSQRLLRSYYHSGLGAYESAAVQRAVFAAVGEKLRRQGSD